MIAADAAQLVPRGPAVLSDTARDMVCSWPDATLVLWAASSVSARDVLSDREHAHAAKLLESGGAAARYIRQQLASGDHVHARARIAMTPGAVLTLGRCRYTVTGRRGALITLIGERGGKADLHPPHVDGGKWWLYRGGLGRPNSKTECYRRDDRDGTFTAAK